MCNAKIIFFQLGTGTTGTGKDIPMTQLAPYESNTIDNGLKTKANNVIYGTATSQIDIQHENDQDMYMSALKANSLGSEDDA